MEEKEYTVTNVYFYEDGTRDEDTKTFDSYKKALGFADNDKQVFDFPPDGQDYTTIEIQGYHNSKGYDITPDESVQIRSNVQIFV